MFDKNSDDRYLPASIRLFSEKNRMFKEVKVKGQHSAQALKDGFSIDLDVYDLPRGTYYLQGGYNNPDKVESIRVVLQ